MHVYPSKYLGSLISNVEMIIRGVLRALLSFVGEAGRRIEAALKYSS